MLKKVIFFRRHFCTNNEQILNICIYIYILTLFNLCFWSGSTNKGRVKENLWQLDILVSTENMYVKLALA